MTNDHNNFELDITYKIEKPPENAMEWRDYENLIISKWNNLLNRDPAPKEYEIQQFLEQYPSLVPGAFNLRGGPSGHYPWLCGLISQPILPSYDYKKPDFMWLSLNSAEEEPVLIEIEDPNKPWFTEKGQPNAKLTQALTQIADWKSWFEEPYHIEEFKCFYGLDREAWRKKHFQPSYLLIYGRQSEANRNPAFTAKRSHLAPDDVTIMTFDRLRPNPSANQLVCMKVTRVNSESIYSTLSIPATLEWSPDLAEERSMLRDLDIAITLNTDISTTRKQFLIKRLAYWNEWSKTKNNGIFNSKDRE